VDSEFGEEDAAPCAAGEEAVRLYGDGTVEVAAVDAAGCAGGGFVSAGSVERYPRGMVETSRWVLRR